MYKKKTKDILNRVIDSFIMDSRFGPKTPKPQNPKTPKPQNPDPTINPHIFKS